MTDYINGRPAFELLGEPKTVRLNATWRGDTFSAPMEVWIMSLVAVLTPEQKAQFFTTMQHVLESRDQQRLLTARVVADIPMPNLGG